MLNASSARWFSAVATFTLLIGCGSFSTADAELRRALNAAYPKGWRFATLAPFSDSEAGPGESPAWVAGDFDGDGRSDYAAQVVMFKPGHTAKWDSAQIVVAFL
ncbi:MAG TPA: hypothetical protein VIF83_07310, partial [Gemmatimonadaceae bacterium]